jgi:hypothetical protein
MEIYRWYVHYVKEIKPGCGYEIYCLKQDESWSKETYFVGPEGLKLARKKFDLYKNDTDLVTISIEECIIEDNEIKPSKTIERISRW